MNRQQKIESIRRGEAVIKNDMKGSDEAINVLKNLQNGSWEATESIYSFKGCELYGWKETDSIVVNRPQILMSELVENKPAEPKEVFTELVKQSIDYDWCKIRIRPSTPKPFQILNRKAIGVCEVIG